MPEAAVYVAVVIVNITVNITSFRCRFIKSSLFDLTLLALSTAGQSENL